MKVALAARSTAKLGGLASETGASVFACDATQGADVEKLFADVEAKFGAGRCCLQRELPHADVRRSRSAEVQKAITVSAFGGFLVAQQAARRMLHTGRARSCSPAHRQRKGLRAIRAVRDGQVRAARLAQALARELSPRGIHVAHVVIDGGIRSERRPPSPDKPDALLDPDAIAESYWHVLQQPRSAWSWRSSCVRGWRISSTSDQIRAQAKLTRQFRHPA